MIKGVVLLVAAAAAAVALTACSGPDVRGLDAGRLTPAPTSTPGYTPQGSCPPLQAGQSCVNGQLAESNPTTAAPPSSPPVETSEAPPSTPEVESSPTSEAPQYPPQVEEARESAESYLGYTAFSRNGLIDQLSSKYGDSYPKNVATQAVDSLDVDWNAQAAQAAQSYLDYTSFSCTGLINQLASKYGSQFTSAQAKFGAHQTKACK
ncbi:Ltp family lipoprotein [Amycolatopsis rhabdoformis]|uniref:Ltp family lipoprotein n=1 Tax=Amycolatopsis rhabdoformis TaxID=1448059 RepID=A0ABZ1IHU7_9PSEU|nr:Ltp family lipoprotein [Amycolatopsis rhabdoformis]WSE33957.1 Ltp family lipoprotein [Amycolatopsis rhabdoformis]